jgi:UDP-N-acetylmuramoylalanine--D-glutamate ligase
MTLEGLQVVVVGMARSGLAAVELLLERGAHVRAVDQNPGAADPPAASAEAYQIKIEPQTDAAFRDADLIVLSPGVPADLEIFDDARRRGTRVVGDLEVASWFLEGETIGITGSNGKTTTTALTGHILQNSGIPVQIGGNIGIPPATMVKASRAGQWNVMELSSFQLETTETFRARVGAVLNVTPDHLDRHHTMTRYAAAKGRVFANQRSTDFAVLNADDPACRAYVDGPSSVVQSQPVWFRVACAGLSERAQGACLENGRIILNGEALMNASEVPLRGLHNLENTMAASSMAHLAGATHAQIRSAVMTFPGVEHRLEFVREIDGVSWYNDSKATNVDAALKAIAAFDGGLWVILGGKDKNGDYTPLAGPIKQKARGVFLIGSAAQKIGSQLSDLLGGFTPLTFAGTMEAAVAQAQARAESGDTVLLAPACSSFDQFQNFEHRGREFKRLIQLLREKSWRG